ncbi:MAG: single-stranded DNA-binding protein [Rickettsiales bacterium]|jgi:single-strand DNA-binding protein|nr:single-stranded DNA-binding protein [Rickettsiales bacterium]
MSVNKVILIGNVGKDPEIRMMNNGNEVALFSLATSDSWKDKTTGERKDKTEWHRIVVYSQGLVGVVRNYVKKGTKLYLSGSIQTRKWVDPSGLDKYATEIILQGFTAELQILDSRNSGNGAANGYDDEYYSSLGKAAVTNGAVGRSDTAPLGPGDSIGETIDDDIPF